MMIITGGSGVKSFGLALINTLISQDHPGKFRQLRVPTKYHDWIPFTSIDYDMSLGTLNQDGPFIVDPTQAFIVLQLLCEEAVTRVSIVLRTQALIEHACSMSTETYIPWEEWGRDAIFMEMPTFIPFTYVQGVHVIEVETRRVLGGNTNTIYMHLRIFDFSMWGCSMLCDESGEAVRTARYKSGRELSLEESRIVSTLGFGSLGNGVFYALVGHFCRWETGVG